MSAFDAVVFKVFSNFKVWSKSNSLEVQPNPEVSSNSAKRCSKLGQAHFPSEFDATLLKVSEALFLYSIFVAVQFLTLLQPFLQAWFLQNGH